MICIKSELRESLLTSQRRIRQYSVVRNENWNFSVLQVNVTHKFCSFPKFFNGMSRGTLIF